VEADSRPVVTAALVAGLLAGFGIAVPVGAVATYLVTLSARTSLRVGAGAALGVATADGLYALIATAGGSALVHVLRPVATPLRWASALVLLALAARIAASAIRGHANASAFARTGKATTGHAKVGAATTGEAPPAQAPPAQARPAGARTGEAPPGPPRAYLSLLGLTMLNPTTVVYFTTLVLGDRTAAASAPLPATVFVVGAFTASAGWQFVLACGGALLGRVLTGGRGRLVTALVSSALIVGLAVRAVAR
jgi:arginine exporter protein ArgO